MGFKFKIEQLALSIRPEHQTKAFSLLKDLGLDGWVQDMVVAQGQVHDCDGETNVAHLQFNYQSQGDNPLELEVLSYKAGSNWLSRTDHDTWSIASHLGMHVTYEQMVDVLRIMEKHNINVVQAVKTISHTNAAIRDSRRYEYIIYETRLLLGIDLKFIIRLPLDQPKAGQSVEIAVPSIDSMDLDQWPER